MGTGQVSFRGIHSICLLFSFMALCAGCSTLQPAAAVRQGDRVWVNYTCRLQSGLVAITTKEDIAENEASHATVFVPFEQYGPESIIAGTTDPGPTFGRLRMFEREVVYRIAQAIVGMQVGKNYTVTLASDVQPNLEPDDRYLTLSRIRPRKKDQRVAHEYVRENIGHEPVIGEQVFAYDGIMGTVKAIDDDYVTVYVQVEDGVTADSPFGTITIRDRDEQYYDCIIDARVGHLVRTDTQIGRIAKVSDRSFTVDYGHPFGGEELVCDIVIESKQDLRDKP